jgi:subtilisin family serine protease
MPISILLSLALTLLCLPGAHAQVTRFDTAPGIEKIQPELLEQMTAHPFVTRQPDTEKMYRVIVDLHASHRTDRRSAGGLARLQQHVQTAQDTVLQSRKRGALTILNRYRNIFAFSALANSEALLELATMGEVEYIETVPIMQKMDLQSHPLTGVDRVHAAGFTGRDVTIAIIDDGIDAAHPAFGGDTAWPNDKIMGGYDFADNDSDPRNDCMQQSHGTAVAGIAAGHGGGVLGTAPDANLVFLKIQSAQQCGGAQLDGDLIGALDWIISHRQQFGIDIISMSLGGQVFNNVVDCDTAVLAIQQLIDMAHDAGIIIFAAAGNEAQPHAIAQPACLSNVISVGAVYDADLGPVRFSLCSDAATAPDRVACYSNSADFLDVLAPAHCATTASTSNGREDCFGGTSSAVPFAAGVAATLLEAAQTPLTNDDMRRLLVESGVAVFDAKSGFFTPRIDAHAAHEALATASLPPLDVSCSDCTP